MKIAFLGTPDFIKPIRSELAKHFTLVDSLNEADLGVVAAYGRILKKDELSAPKYGFINVHPSLLPKYRGSSPIQSAILNGPASPDEPGASRGGDKTSGITIIKMDEEMDHGPIIYQEEIGLSASDNFNTLSKKMFQRAAEVLPQIIEDFISGKIKPVEQNHKNATFCKILTKEDGFFEIDKSPENLTRMIRAYYPWPSAWILWKGKIVKFLPNDMMQMEGKKAISKLDFLNGYPDFPLKSITLDKK